MNESYVGKIIKINIFVFFLWIILYSINPLIMTQNFLVSYEALGEGRVWTLLTSVFSHNTFFHIFINMYVFYGFGKMLELTLGPKRFLRFYLIAGIVGSLAHSFTSAFILHQPALPALGASGAISGVLVVFAFFYPHQKVYFLGFIPLPAFWAIIPFIGIDLWGLIAQTRGSQIPIGYGAHLGGALTGLIYYYHFSHHFTRNRFQH